ncbi:general stress protein [Psychrobacillus sp. OK032]|uniref:general stress protein n=1 Tax=Psychrobacillus sp. OK032 TaxID=1884358 RepID=UPI0008CF85D2|nr:general stress protein [Psychrobacillus sp. OK032]SER99739.1 Heat induced stress protein YflT [Psychrobacillus sp. OK032]
MNIESNRRIEIARSEEEMYEKLELLQEQGYEESDIHVISQENTHLYTLNRHSDVSTHEAGTFVDRFKSFFTGEDSITEGLRRLDLSEEETEHYAGEVARGSIVLYTDVLTFADNASTDRFDEPQDRFARGETFASDPYLVGGERRLSPEQYEERKEIKEKLDEIPPRNRLY